MRQTAILAVLAATAVTAACGVPLSVNPLYGGKEDLVTNAQIEGRWTDEDGQDIWEIRKEGTGYVFAKAGEPESEELSLHVVAIGRSWFVDVAPRKTPDLAIEGHVFLKAQFEGDEFVVQLLDWNWLQDQAAQYGLAQVDIPNSQCVLTASPAELQRFLSMYADDPRAFEEGAVRLRRAQ
jgi:hypothetical protein